MSCNHPRFCFNLFFLHEPLPLKPKFHCSNFCMPLVVVVFKRSSDITSAKAVCGTCKDMCPEKVCIIVNRLLNSCLFGIS